MAEKALKNFSKDDTLVVKGIAILFMLFHHLFGCERPLEAQDLSVSIYPFSFSYFQLLGATTKLCVALFVFVSSYAITIQCNSRELSTQNLCVKRILKLFKGYFFIFLLALLTSGLRNDNIIEIYSSSGSTAFVNILFDALGVSSYFNTPTMNPTWWYTGFAYFIFCFVPCLVIAYEKIGYGLLILFALSGYLGIQGSMGIAYLLTMALGVCIAETNLLGRICEYNIGKLTRKKSAVIKLIICIGIFIILLPGWLTYTIYINAILSFDIALLAMLINELLPFGTGFLKALGKHSMNIYLIHTLVYYYYFPHFIYSFKHWFFVLMALVFICLFLSIIIEKLKSFLYKIYSKY